MSGNTDIQDRQTRKCEDCGTLFSVTAKDRQAKIWLCRTCRKPPVLTEAPHVGRVGRAGLFPQSRNRKPMVGGRR